MKNPVYESMTLLKIQVGPWEDDVLKIRVWRTETSPACQPNEDIYEKARELQVYWSSWDQMSCLDPGTFIEEVSRQIGGMDRVAAVEVLKKNGNGIVFYPDWN